MSLSLTLACAWALFANLVAMLPSRDNHWTWAYVLIAVGVPILGLVTYQHGALVGMLVLAAGMSLLRWPVVYLWRWVKTRAGQ